MRILFQGDSVTDCGRNREDFWSLGSGYPSLFVQRMAKDHPEVAMECINRGISGNRVPDLIARWDVDCLALAPDVVSILIGINDTWRRYDQNDPTGTAAFEAGYRKLLIPLVQGGNTRIVLMEPFVLPTPQDRLTWREDIDPKIQVVRNLAREFGCDLVPLDALFAVACTKEEPKILAGDGVHPTQAGHALICENFMKVMGW